MLVRAKVSFGKVRAGQVAEVPDAQARMAIKRGYAEDLTDLSTRLKGSGDGEQDA